MSELRGRDEVIKHIVRQLWAMLSISDEKQAKKVAEAILSIPELAIVDREAQPPIRFIHPDASGVLSYEQCKQDMLKAGYVKEVKDD